ncbi:hypothetical protein D3C78_833780 [compost metagenome]
MADIEYIAGVIEGFCGFWLGGNLRLAEAPVGAIGQMQRQLGDNRIERGGGRAHLRQGAQFADQQGVSAGKVDQEQIVLGQIAAESRFG